jgi:hypothetical protein
MDLEFGEKRNGMVTAVWVPFNNITGAMAMQDDNWKTTEYTLDVKDPWQGICLFLTGVCCGIIVTILFQHFAR